MFCIHFLFTSIFFPGLGVGVKDYLGLPKIIQFFLNDQTDGCRFVLCYYEKVRFCFLTLALAVPKNDKPWLQHGFGGSGFSRFTCFRLFWCLLKFLLLWSGKQMIGFIGFWNVRLETERRGWLLKWETGEWKNKYRMSYASRHWTCGWAPAPPLSSSLWSSSPWWTTSGGASGGGVTPVITGKGSFQ